MPQEYYDAYYSINGLSIKTHNIKIGQFKFVLCFSSEKVGITEKGIR